MSFEPPVSPDNSLLAARDADLDWGTLESLVHADPGQRGLASYRRDGQCLDAGQLRLAALELAQHAHVVGIVTGFCAVLDDLAQKRVTAETDGPPGALTLAKTLQSLGIEVLLISDRPAMPLLSAGCELLELSPGLLVEIPIGPSADEVVHQLLARDRPLTHLVAIERPGPSHTLESIRRQSDGDAAIVSRFEREVPPADFDKCHTMRGAVIDAYTAPTHRLFDEIRSRGLPITTIAIGDGGNELGLGRCAWQDLVTAVGSDCGGRIACRVAADFALIAGVSNWGGYALASAVAQMRGATDRAWLEPGLQQALVAAMIAAGGVDGRTLQAEPTVDGLAAEAYLHVIAAVRGLF